MEPRVHADEIITEHTAYSMAAAMIPVPLADVGAVTLVQLDMVKELAEMYSVKYDLSRGKAIILSLGGSTVAKFGASAIKAMPVGGTFVGGVTQAILSGSSTYAVGHVFQQHFEARGNMDDLDPDAVRSRYREYVEKGKRIARTLRGKVIPTSAPSVEEVAETLERLGRLKESGVISQEEFEGLKAPLLAGL